MAPAVHTPGNLMPMSYKSIVLPPVMGPMMTNCFPGVGKVAFPLYTIVFFSDDQGDSWQRSAAPLQVSNPHLILT